MCGIIGYIGFRDAQEILLSGLKFLEYRGYDSAGLCVFVDMKGELLVRKLPGKVRDLEQILKKQPLGGNLALGHVRWATHGAPNRVNAHPHLDCKDEIAVVHNGIIENYAELRQQLIKEGHVFKSQTDTEIIPHLIEKFYRRVSLEEAVQKAIKLLSGSFAIGVLSKREPFKLVGARCGSPLIIGLGKNENFLASDIPAVLTYTREIVFLEEREMVVLSKDKIKIHDFSAREVRRKPVVINWDAKLAQKGGFTHFMLKEINEQPAILEAILKYRLNDRGVYFEELGAVQQKELARVKDIVIIACGTAYHAGLIGKYILEELTGIPVAVDLSSEFRYRRILLNKHTLVIAISQSGETADTLAALRRAKDMGAKSLGICNVLGSTLTRECNAIIYTHAGPEISVASTKAYTAQLTTLYLLAFYLARLHRRVSSQKISRYLSELKKIPPFQRRILIKQKIIRRLAHRHSHFGSFLFLGRNINYPSALEGALKLKEVSYIPAEGYAAGEMKHGPIALIDEYRAVVCICPQSKTYEKMFSNMQEICARCGRMIIVASENDRKIAHLSSEVIYIPVIEEVFSPLLVILPLQLLAYFIAVKRGCDVDQPRNLAKSVTVE